MRYAILADVHGNLAAFDAVLGRIGEVDGVWCLGDNVGYGPEPNECVTGVMAFSGPVVAGNHDLGAIGKTSLDLFNPYAREACRWTSEVLDEDCAAYLRSLPKMAHPLEDVLLVHGSPRDPLWEYVLTLSQAEEILQSRDERCIFVGHSHIPFVFRWLGKAPEIIPLVEGRLALDRGSKYLINPGSIGQPRDGDPRASFMIFEPDELEIEYRRVAYPIERTQAKMADVGLDHFLIERLSLGE